MTRLRSRVDLRANVLSILRGGFPTSIVGDELISSLLDAVDEALTQEAKGKKKFYYRHREFDCAGCGAPGCLATPSPGTGAPMYVGRIQDVASENFGPFPRQTDEEAMTAIERGIFEQRLTIERLTHPPAAPAAETGKPATCGKCGAVSHGDTCYRCGATPEKGGTP